MLGQVLEEMHHVFEREGPHDGSRKIAHAAQNHHHDGVGAHVKPHQLRIHESGLGRPQVTRDTGQRARQREGRQLVAESAETDGPHAVLVDADARERAAERRKQDPAQQQIDTDQCH